MQGLNFIMGYCNYYFWINCQKMMKNVTGQEPTVLA